MSAEAHERLKQAAGRFIQASAQLAEAKREMIAVLHGSGWDCPTVITTPQHGAVLCNRRGAEWTFEAVGVVGAA